MSAALVIDGYNVLFQTPLMVTDNGQIDSKLSRRRLIAFTASVIGERYRANTVIVFDSKQTQTEEAAIEQHPSGIQIVFASNYAEADQYIEDLIIKHAQPRSLWVVSSDGKIKQTARSYGAKTQEARDWYEQNLKRISVADQAWIRQGTLPRFALIENEQSSAADASDGMPDPKQIERANRELSDEDLAKFLEMPMDED